MRNLHLIYAVQALLVVASIWYRVATAHTDKDFVRLCAKFQYLLVLLAFLLATVIAEIFLSSSFDASRAVVAILILSWAVILTSQYEPKLLGLFAPILFFLDDRNSLAVNAAATLIFWGSIVLGTIFGSWLFYKVYGARLGQVAAERIARSSRW